MLRFIGGHLKTVRHAALCGLSNRLMVCGWAALQLARQGSIPTKPGVIRRSRYDNGSHFEQGGGLEGKFPSTGRFHTNFSRGSTHLSMCFGFFRGPFVFSSPQNDSTAVCASLVALSRPRGDTTQPYRIHDQRASANQTTQPTLIISLVPNVHRQLLLFFLSPTQHTTVLLFSLITRTPLELLRTRASAKIAFTSEQGKLPRTKKQLAPEQCKILPKHASTITPPALAPTCPSLGICRSLVRGRVANQNGGDVLVPLPSKEEKWIAMSHQNKTIYFAV